MLEIYAILRCGLTLFALVARLLSLTLEGRNCLMDVFGTCTVLLTLAALSCACGGKNAGVKTTKVIQPATRPVAKDATAKSCSIDTTHIAQGVKTLNATVELKPTAGSANTAASSRNITK